jgi:hypothetical protein
MNARQIFSILLLLLLATACEKVIDVDLREVEPQLVIEANITDQPGPYFVRLTRTVNFNVENSFPPITNAIVTLSDNTGTEEVLSETSPGSYETNSIVGTPGRTYRLSVISEGQEYVATATMPASVTLDDITIEEGGFIGETENEVVVRFQDVPGVKNYYRFVAWKNDVPFNRPYVFEDKGYDGKNLQYSFEPDEDNENLKIEPQNKITVEMQGVDPNVYLYFLTLAQYTGEGPPTAPANPTTNISGGALGYFSTHTTSRMSIIVE